MISHFRSDMKTGGVFNLLLLLLQGAYQLQHVCGDIIYITPQRDTTCPPGESCQTLMQYVNSLSISSNVTLVMLSGNHNLSAQLSITRIATFTMVPSFNDASPSTVICSESGQLVLSDIQNVKISGLTFIRCGGNTADSVDNLLLENSFFMGATPQEVDARGAWTITTSTSLTMKNCKFTDNIATGTFGKGGAMNINGIKNLTIQSCTFTSNQVTCDSSGEGGALAVTVVDLH